MGETPVSPLPWLERFLAQAPELAGPVHRLLEAGRLLREVAERAFVDPPEPPASEKREALGQIIQAADALRANPSREKATALCQLLFVQRFASYQLTPTRATSGPVARWVLSQALELWLTAWQELEEQCVKAGLLPPLRLRLTSHLDEALPWSQARLVGNQLPQVPTASLPWGERCALTGRWWQVEGQPSLRFRCAESFFTLTEEAYEAFAHCQDVIASLRQSQPALAEAICAAFPELASPFYPDTLGLTFAALGLRDFPSLAVSLHNALKRFAPRPLFLRPEDKKILTYGEVHRQALGLAKALQDLGLAPGDRLALAFSKPGWEAYLADFACVFSRLVSVALDPFTQVEGQRQILDRALPKMILGDGPGLAKLEGYPLPLWCLDAEPSKPHLPVKEPPQDWVSASGMGLTTPLLFDDGPGWEEAARWGVVPDGKEDLYTIIFTSGSTGKPKAVPITRTRMRSGMAYDAPLYPLVVASYQPHALLADRKAVWQVLFNGGTVGFCRRGPALWEDLARLGPTYLEGPPALFQALVNPYLEALRQGVGARALARLRLQVRQRLGGRLVAAAVGGAPVPAELQAALEACLRASVREAYGATEVGTIAEDGQLRPGVVFRLVDRPDLGFTSGDQPYPRGELAVKLPDQRPPYLEVSTAPEGRVTEDGYFLTGDLVELLPGRRIRVLGRTAQAVKLADGRFVAAEELERVALACGLCRHAALITTAQGPVLVVVAEGAVPPQELRTRLAWELNHHLGGRALPPILVDPQRTAWTPENGLLSPSLKPRKQAIAEHYRQLLSTVSSTPEGVVEAATEEGLRETLAQILKQPLHELDWDVSASQQGLDSLAAAAILALADARGVALTLEEVYHLSLGELVGKLGKATPSPERATTPKVAAPATAEEALMRQVLRTPLPKVLPDFLPRGLTLVSGTTGFLGVHLLRALAAHPPGGGPVVALIRAADHHHARTRQQEAALRAGVVLPELGLPKDPNARIWTLACKLGEENLGLSEDLYTLLAQETAVILHAAASVRHGAGFSEMVEDNVTPAHQLLHLATHRRLKAFHLVSTLDVTRLAQRLGVSGNEEAPLPQRLGETAAQLDGYVASKWVVERMAELLHRHCQGKLPLLVSRPGLLLWSPSGFAPLKEWFPALLASCLKLGLLPLAKPAVVPSEPVTTETSARGLEPLPVDYVGELCSRLTSALLGSVEQKGSSFFRLNLVNTNPGTKGLALWPQIFCGLQAAYLAEFPQKDPLRMVSYRDFLDTCLAQPNPFTPLVPHFADLPALPRMPANTMKAFAQQMPPPPLSWELFRPFARFALQLFAKETVDLPNPS